MEADVDQGPLIDERAVEKVTTLVEDATAHGASLACGGKSAGGLSFEPTLLCDVTDKMQIAHAEIFGHVVAISRFTTEAEVIALANNVET